MKASGSGDFLVHVSILKQHTLLFTMTSTVYCIYSVYIDWCIRGPEMIQLALLLNAFWVSLTKLAAF